MPTPHTPLVEVQVAEDPAGDVSQDRVFVLPHAVLVLDGASAPDPQERDGGWYADTLGRELETRLTNEPQQDLDQALRESIAALATRHALRPGGAPSSTVTMLRWTEDIVDALVLGDSALIVQTTSGLDVLHDMRLQGIAPDIRNAIGQRLASGAGYGEEHHELHRRLVEQEKAHRNRPDGYWIAEATPEAADHALSKHWARLDVQRALLMTDGVSRATTLFGTSPTWTDAFTLATSRGLNDLLRSVRDAERHDPAGRRWPRTRSSDDQAAALLHFHRKQASGAERITASRVQH